MSVKEFIKPKELMRDSFALAKKIHDSAYRPEVLLVLWRGGTPVGVVIHEFLLYKGIETYHTAVKAESYRGMKKRTEPEIGYLKPVLDVLDKDNKVLLIDDIFDTGLTLKKVCGLLGERTRNIKIATLYYKESRNMTDITPDFFLRKTANWIVFPHELVDLTPEEIRTKGDYVHGLGL